MGKVGSISEVQGELESILELFSSTENMSFPHIMLRNASISSSICLELPVI